MRRRWATRRELTAAADASARPDASSTARMFGAGSERPVAGYGRHGRCRNVAHAAYACFMPAKHTALPFVAIERPFVAAAKFPGGAVNPIAGRAFLPESDGPARASSLANGSPRSPVEAQRISVFRCRMQGLPLRSTQNRTIRQGRTMKLEPTPPPRASTAPAGAMDSAVPHRFRSTPPPIRRGRRPGAGRDHGACGAMPRPRLRPA